MFGPRGAPQLSPIPGSCTASAGSGKTTGPRTLPSTSTRQSVNWLRLASPLTGISSTTAKSESRLAS